MTGRFDLPNGDAAPDPVLLAVGAGTAAAPSDVAAVAPPALAPAPRPPAAAAIRHASAIRQVLLHVTPDHHPGQQLAVGVDVAARFGAKLVALYPIRRPLALRRMLESGSPAGPVGRDGAPHGTLPGTPPGTHGGAERLRRVADLARAAVLRHMLPAGSPVVAAAVEAERAKARAVLDRLSRMAGPARVELEWHAVEGDAGALLSEVGSFHDLIVAPAGDARPGEAGPDPTRRAALRSGRPVLAVPRGWASPRVGRRVLVLWNGTREAALAARAALPFLATAESVTVLTTPDRLPLDVAGLPIFGLGDFLWRHGVVAATTPFETAGAEPARALLDHAAAGGADLVVSGAFGPLPARTWPAHGWRLAGFTRALLAQARTPLLLCH